jgi:hypothetical protein
MGEPVLPSTTSGGSTRALLVRSGAFWAGLKNTLQAVGCPKLPIKFVVYVKGNPENLRWRVLDFRCGQGTHCNMAHFGGQPDQLESKPSPNGAFFGATGAYCHSALHKVSPYMPGFATFQGHWSTPDPLFWRSKGQTWGPP